MTEDVLKGARIFIFQQRGWAISIGHDLAKVLQARGAILAAMTFKRSTDNFVRSQKEVDYESIWSDEDIEESPTSFLGDSPPSLADVCDELGVDTIWEIVQSRRTQVKSYGDGFYYRYRQNVDDDHIENYVKAMFVVFKRILDEFNPEVIVVPVIGGLPHIFLSLLARKRGIRMIGITDTKVYAVSAFTYSHTNELSPLVERIDQLNNGQAQSENLEKAREYIRSTRSKYRTTRVLEQIMAGRKKSLYRTIRGLLGELRHSRNSPNYVKGLGPSIDARPYKIVIRDFIRRRQYERAADKIAMPKLDARRPYCLFPLQTDPEIALDVYAPRFNNQLETARQIAMSMPGDMKLIVKDHPVMRGQRSAKYLEKLARTPNILLVNSDYPIADLMRQCRLVITTAGTVSIEAALLKIPVIQLGNLGTNRRLPNVTCHSDLSTMTNVINQVIELDYDTDDYERRLENYVAATYDVGFNDDYRRAWEESDKGEGTAIIERYLSEIERCLA